MPSAVAAERRAPPLYELPPINYSQTSPKDAVANLASRLARGEVAFTGSDQTILREVLKELNVPIASQLLVFSRTSLQAGLIRPANPRALYFSDSIYVGWVPGGLLEVVAIDDQLGPIFYAFDPQDARDHRRSFVRETSCLRCHGGATPREAPTLFARSLFTNDRGEPLVEGDADLTDDRTAFEQRWGGWYVSGYAGETPHRGNAFATMVNEQILFRPSALRPRELSGFFDTSKYLTNTSDAVALLVFQHQLTMHDALTRAAFAVRRALAHQKQVQNSRDEKVAAESVPPEIMTIVDRAATDVVDHLLFREAAALPDGFDQSSDFSSSFASGAIRDAKGNALRDFSLHGRLFRNRCSFLIYSDSFRELPPLLKSRIFKMLKSALQNDDAGSRYSYLGEDERRKIYDILVATLPEAKAMWGNSSLADGGP